MLRMLIKNAARDSSIYLATGVVVAALGFITLPIFARIFVPAEYGLLSLALLIVSLGTVITGNWLISSTNRFYPYWKRIGKLDTFYATLLFSMLLALIGFCLLGTLFYLLFRNSFSGKFRVLVPLVFLLVPLTMAMEIFLTNFRIKQQSKQFATFKLSRTFLGLLIGLSLVIWLQLGIQGILWGHIIALFIIGGMMFRMLFLTNNHCQLRFVSLSVIREFAAFGLPAMAATIGTWILSGADRYVIEYFRGTSEVGLYSMGYNVGDMCVGMFVSSLMLGIGPSIINVWESENRELTGELLSQLTRFLILISLPVVAGISVLARPVFRLFTTPAYYPGSAVIPFVAGGAFIYGLSLLAYMGLGLAKRTDIVARNYFSAAGINILLNIIFVPKFGFIAAAVTTTISYVLLLFMNIKSANKYLKWVVIPRSLFNSIMASIVMGGVLFLVISIFANPLFICILGIIVGVIVYFATLFLLKEFHPEEIAEMKNFVRGKLWKRQD